MDSLFYAFAALVFAAVILLTEGAWLWWSGNHGSAARRIARRLRHMSGGVGEGEQISILKQRRYCGDPWADALLHKLPLCAALDRALQQAGVKWSVLQFAGATVGALALALLLLAGRNTPWLADLTIACMCACVPWLLLTRARMARMIRIEQQLPEAADFLARAMRAGHSFNNVLQMVGAELPEPMSGEFRLAHEEINYGVPMNEALYNLADRIPLTDLRYLVIAVVIQRESGGNLAEILGSISHIIRERLKLLAKVRVLSAEGRMSAWVLGSLPFAMIILMSIINPLYVSVLWTDEIGQQMLWTGAGMIVIGTVWIRRIVRIRV